MVEQQRYVVMHAAIATDLPAPHISHVCVMNAVSCIPTLGLCVLDLGTHRFNELRDRCIAQQYISEYMAWDMQVAWWAWQSASTAANATIHNLELKVAQVVAENSSVKAMNDCLSEEMRGYESDGAFEGPKMHLLWWQCETPATDAYLAEVRAQGVEMFGQYHNFSEKLFIQKESKKFAAQLRKGAAL